MTENGAVQDHDRFGQDFVTAHLMAHGKRTPEQRQLTYDIAVGADYAPWRRWYGEQLALLPTAQADALSRRLWLTSTSGP